MPTLDGGVMRGHLQGLNIAYVLAAGLGGIAAMLVDMPAAQPMQGAGSSGITIPIRPLVAPLRRGEPKQTPAELRRTIPERPRGAPPQRSRKPARTEFADMDLPVRAG